MTAVVPVFHPRAEPRRAVKQGYPRAAGSVRLCRTLGAVERLLFQRLVDAVVLDVKAAPDAALALPARFPRIPMFVLSALRPDDGALLASCHASGFAGLPVAWRARPPRNCGAWGRRGCCSDSLEEGRGQGHDNAERGMRNAEQQHGGRPACSAFRVPTSAFQGFRLPRSAFM